MNLQNFVFLTKAIFFFIHNSMKRKKFEYESLGKKIAVRRVDPWWEF